MPKQVVNPLDFFCAPNACTPDYITYHDLRSWVAYGLMKCWLGCKADDPNAGCHFSRKWTRDDVDTIRSHFLNVVEITVVGLWRGDITPGMGELEGDWDCHYVGPEEDFHGNPTDHFIKWYVRLDDDAIMFDLCVGGGDPQTIWLAYEAVADRQNVLKVLTEARATVTESAVSDDLIELAK
jgi:hypothetical protein